MSKGLKILRRLSNLGKRTGSLTKQRSLSILGDVDIPFRHNILSLPTIAHNNRVYSTSLEVQGSRNQDINFTADGLTLQYGSYNLNLLYVWLRDHCRCSSCYNHKTYQKNIDNYELNSDIQPIHVEFDGTVLTLKWPDNHITSYNINWLLENTYHEHHADRVTKTLWNKDIIMSNTEPFVKYKEYMTTDDGIKAHLRNLMEFGFSVVTEGPANHESTVEVSKRLCFIQETLFGYSWSFTSDMAFEDTAYTTVALGAHTDSTYFMSPSGIQVFHVLEHQGTGGETLLVDGFHAAEVLRETNPTAFNCLSERVVPHEYFDAKERIRSLGTVLRLHPTTGQLINIRFNPYDRSPLFTLPHQEIKQFYQSYAALTNEIKKSENELWIKLRPGMVLFVDNWRVLHGRSSFTGLRRVSGCYLPRDDWFGKARLYGLQNL